MAQRPKIYLGSVEAKTPAALAERYNEQVDKYPMVSPIGRPFQDGWAMVWRMHFHYLKEEPTEEPPPQDMLARIIGLAVAPHQECNDPECPIHGKAAVH